MFSLSSCQFDSWEKGLPNDYRISWVDLPSNRNISHETRGNRILSHVFEVGYNNDYIIAKQHPQIGSILVQQTTDKTVTNFFILRMEKNGIFKNVKERIYGPLTEREFKLKQKELEISDIEFSIKYVVDEGIRMD